MENQYNESTGIELTLFMKLILKEEQTSYDDSLDALRLSLKGNSIT
jgi:hypothetical protein